MSFFELGLPDLAVTILKSGVRQISSSYPGEAGQMSRYYILLADRLFGHGQKKEAAEVLLLSIEIQPLPLAYNRLARIAVEEREYEQAVRYFQQSLQLDADQTHVHTNLGQITARFLKAHKGIAPFPSGVSIGSQAGSRICRLDVCYKEGNWQCRN